MDRMGFVLDSLCVRALDGGTSEIRVVFETAGPLSADTFVYRIAQLHGIQALEHGPLE